MADFTTTRAVAGFPVFRPSGAGLLGCAFGTFTIAANPTAADIGSMCKLPRNATVVDGVIYGDDLDTGVETLDFDVGWAANDTEVADPDGFGNFGIVAGDPVTGINPVASIWMPLGGVLRTAGPKTFTAETTLTVTFNVAAATGGTGQLTLAAYYVTP